ncbi:uncharacterized protein LOC143344799 [Colletes latitarsis]|uniref:uncharacterized protein LOC143344535 n=1 Tax=Colletes latitarsis TaxID=2605962 RepID=UPI0040363C5D
MQTNSQKRENIEKTILALLLSRKEACTLSQLSNDYYKMEGEQIPWKALGYLSLLNFVHSLSKTVQVEFWNNVPFVKGIASDKSKHVSKLVAGQKCQKYPIGRKLHKPSQYYPVTPPPKVLISSETLTNVIHMVNKYPDGVNKDFVLHYIQSQVPHVNIVMSDIENQLRELSHMIGQTNNKFFPIKSMLKNGDSVPPMVTAGGDEDSDNIFNYNNEDDFTFVPSTSIPKSPCTTSRTKSTSNFIQESVSKYQHEVAEYKTLEHTSIVQSDQNSLDNVHSYNDNVELSNNPEKSIHKESNKENSSDNEDTDFIVNQRVQFRLEKLIQNNPDGIWCADLPQKYLEEYKFSLNYAEYGFNSVREFASHLSNIFHCVQPYKTGDFMLYYAKREIPSNKSQEKQKVVNLAQLHYIYEIDNEVEALPSSLSLDTCKKIIPDGVVTIGESVGQLDVVELANAETPYIEIIVVEVFTPSFFWIQLRKKQKVFKVFMDDIHNFYTKNHEKYVMPPVLLEKGLNCVCMYNGIWHRGIIKNVNPDLNVTVMFYDYGTLKTYPPEEIHYLHRMFSIIPAQAIPCGLVNTKPYSGSKWSASATHYFALRTSQIPLIATIASINTEDNSMLIALTDTLEEEDVHINDWLVEQNLAQHGKMEDKVDMKNLLIYVEENLLYSPEKCYAAEVDISNTNENSVQKSKNMPLISPQSTLDDTLFVSTAERTLSNELKKLIPIEEENLQVRTSENDLLSTIFSPTKTNTNPFLQDDSQVVSEITPKEFMRLWKENLQLQMQIAATFNILFNKVIKKSDMNIDDNPTKDGNILNITDNTFLHTNKSIQTAVNDTVSSVANNYNNLKENFDAVCQSLENKGMYKNENVPQGFENINPKFNLDIQNYFLNHTTVDVPKSSEKLRNNNGPFKETNPFKLSLLGELQILDSQEENCLSSNRLTPISNENEELVIERDLINCEKENSNVQSINHNIPENLFRDASFNHHQYFDTNSSSNANNNKNNSSALNAKSVSTDYTWTMDNLSNNMSKVIVNNPFIRDSINNINETEEHVETNNESVLNSPHCNYNTFAYTPSYLRISSKEHVMDQEHKDNLAPVSCSSLTNKSFVDHNVQTIDKINEETKFFTNNATNFNQTTLTYNNDCTMSKGASNYNSISKNDDTSNYVSSLWLPFNSFLPPVPVVHSDINTDEGYLSRPSTSHTLYTPTFLKQMNNEAEHRQQSLTKNLNEICDIHARDIQCENYGTIYPSYFKENKDIEIACSDSQWQNNSENVTMKDTEVQVNIDNLEVKNLYSKESELRNIWKSPTSKESTYAHKNPICQTYSSAKRKIFYQTIKLPKRTVHLFHHKGEGWLLVDEFMRFTEFQTVSCMLDFFNFVGIHVPFEEIDKNQYSIEYITFFSIFPKTMQDITNDINNFQLISLKSIVKLLTQLKFISQKDINICIMHNAFINKEFLDGSVTHEISLISNAYGQLKQYIENKVQI